MDDQFVYRQKLIMIMGMQRSGTTALLYTLGQDPSIQVENEEPGGPIWDNYRLRPEPEIRHVLWRIKRRILLKPVVEIEYRTIDDVLEEFARYDPLVVWIYRDPVNVWSSAKSTFHLSSTEMDDWIQKWVDGNQSALRSLKGPNRDRITVVRYGDLIEHRAVFDKLCEFLNIEPRNNLFWRQDLKKGRKRLTLDIQQQIESKTRETLDALHHHRIRPPALHHRSDVQAFASKASKWELTQIEPCAARLEAPSDAIGTVRIELDHVDPEQPFGVQAVWAGLSLLSGQRYTLSFWAKADRDKEISVMVSQNRDPWGLLGPCFPISLSTQWKHVGVAFTPSIDEPVGRVHIDIGSDDTAIELTKVDVGSPIFTLFRLECHEGARATIEPVETFTNGVRVVTHELSSSEPSTIQLTAGHADVIEGEQYSVVFSARSKVERTIAVALGEDVSPWRTMGLYQVVATGWEWRQFRYELQASINGEARLYFDLGQSQEAVEIADVSFFQTKARIHRFWILPGADCYLAFPPADSSCVRVLPKPTPQAVPQDVQLFMSQLAIERGVRYQVSFRARADEPRDIGMGVNQGHEPWDGLGLYHVVGVNTQWKQYHYEWVPEVTEAQAQVLFDVGQSPVPVEIADVLLKAGPTEIGPEEMEKLRWIVDALDPASASADASDDRART